MNNPRFILEPYKGPSSRYKCPQCGKSKELSLYIDTTNGNHLADNVGRCNRENECGYHLTPSQWIQNGGIVEGVITPKEQKTPELQPISFLGADQVLKSMEGLTTSNLAVYLSSLFTESVAISLLENYGVGRAKADNGKASLYWRIDKDYNVRGGKIVRHNPATGKRDRDFEPYAISGVINKQRRQQGLKELRFEQCFFGEHRLAQEPDIPVGIVEGERTALIASVILPNMVWLSTGGASGCKWREYEVYKVLNDRTCVFYPDYGFFNKKTGKTCYDEWSERVERIASVMSGSFKVSTVLEKYFNGKERKDEDLADVILNRDETGLAITEAINDEYPGYPVIFDWRGFWHNTRTHEGKVFLRSKGVSGVHISQAFIIVIL